MDWDLIASQARVRQRDVANFDEKYRPFQWAVAGFVAGSMATLACGHLVQLLTASRNKLASSQAANRPCTAADSPAAAPDLYPPSDTNTACGHSVTLPQAPSAAQSCHQGDAQSHSSASATCAASELADGSRGNVQATAATSCVAQSDSRSGPVLDRALEVVEARLALEMADYSGPRQGETRAELLTQVIHSSAHTWVPSDLQFVMNCKRRLATVALTEGSPRLQAAVQFLSDLYSDMHQVLSWTLFRICTRRCPRPVFGYAAGGAPLATTLHAAVPVPAILLETLNSTCTLQIKSLRCNLLVRCQRAHQLSTAAVWGRSHLLSRKHGKT